MSTTFKVRPALLIQSQEIPTGLEQQLVAMITSNTRRTGPSRVFIAQETPEGQAMGLLTDSMILADNLATVANAAISRSIGK